MGRIVASRRKEKLRTWANAHEHAVKSKCARWFSLASYFMLFGGLCLVSGCSLSGTRILPTHLYRFPLQALFPPLGIRATAPSISRESNLFAAVAFPLESIAGAPLEDGARPGSGETRAAADGLGWIELPNTKLQDVCPPNTDVYDFHSNCHSLIDAWSGGVADAARNRLIIWGGGHNDYYGNEIYALDLNTNKLTRLNEPSPVNGNPPFHSPECVEALSDGAPNSRHTYGGLAYIAHADRMFVFSGSLGCAGGGVGDDTWTLDLATLKWRRMDPTGNKNAHPNPVYFDAMADYDPVTKLVFIDDRGSALWSYSYERNTYTPLVDTPGLGLGSNAVVDPKRRQFLIFGPDAKAKPSLHSVNIGSSGHYAMRDLTAKAVGCDVLMGKDADYPGLAYDPVIDRIVGWVNAVDTNSVYIYDPDKNTCTTRTFPGGPVVRPEARGVSGRWRYFPGKGVFALVSDARQNAFLLRLTSAEGTTATQVDPPAPRVARNSDPTPLPTAAFKPGSLPVPSSSNSSRALAADADFAARCAAPGVVRCYGFDDPADAMQYIRPGDLTGENRTRVVTDMNASGAGSLRFTIPSQSGGGSSGSFSIDFSPDLSFQVGEGQEFYIQWRQRFSADLLKTIFTNSEGFKQVIISDGDRPGHIANACTQLEIVLQNTSQQGAPQLYHSCGEKDGAYEPLTVYNSYRTPGKYEVQNGLNPPCLWQEVKSPPCVMYKPDQWMTFQIHVRVGTWYKNDRKYHHDSTVQLWVAYEGKPSKLVIDFGPKSDSGGYDIANQDPINKYGKIWLLPYQTHKDPTQVHPVGYTWYDELIISRNRISDPGAIRSTACLPSNAAPDCGRTSVAQEH
jgi:hypothetical protein